MGIFLNNITVINNNNVKTLLNNSRGKKDITTVNLPIVMMTNLIFQESDCVNIFLLTLLNYYLQNLQNVAL